MFFLNGMFGCTGKIGFVTMTMTWSQLSLFIRTKPDGLRCYIFLSYTVGQLGAWLRPANLQSMLRNAKTQAERYYGLEKCVLNYNGYGFMNMTIYMFAYVKLAIHWSHTETAKRWLIRSTYNAVIVICTVEYRKVLFVLFAVNIIWISMSSFAWKDCQAA